MACKSWTLSRFNFALHTIAAPVQIALSFVGRLKDVIVFAGGVSLTPKKDIAPADFHAIMASVVGA